MIESALMIAFASVLSVLKLVDMPYGGSVTFASMLPVAIIAYRHGLYWGLGAGTVYAVVQQLLGLENFAYLPVPTWQAMVALCILDYLVAFAVIGFAGIFRAKLKGHEGSQAKELALGIALVSVLRYILHTVAGFTVWAGLLIPDAAALGYSIGYNATYMIPETIVNVCVALYIGSVIDFTRPTPMPFAKHRTLKSTGDALGIYVFWARLGALAVLLGGIIADACLIFKHIQDPESGAFSFAYLSEANWLAIGIVSVACAVISAGLFISTKLIEKRKTEAAEE